MSNIGQLKQLLSEVRRLEATVEGMIEGELKKSFYSSENLEEPRDYPQSVSDIIDETRHGGNMIGGNRE